MTRKIIILGSGCAGSTAAVYAARANLQPLVLEGHEPGGQLSLTTAVENFPGFPEGIQGPELVQLMKTQAERFGAEYKMEAVRQADLSSRPFTLQTDYDSYQAEALIVASGASAMMLGLPGEKRLLGHGVSTCATCDGYFFRNRKVVVVGGGDTAMEDSIFLTRFAEQVTVIHRRDELRASKIMAERARSNAKIDFIWDTVVADIMDPEKKSVEAVLLKNLKTGKEHILKTDGVFVAIGHKPNTEVFEGQLELDRGYIVLFEGSRTSVEGVFAAGDVHDRVYRQAITAAGAGCRAAMDAEKYLEEHSLVETPITSARAEPR
jgi:thioredoxin reductase (NADPH)